MSGQLLFSKTDPKKGVFSLLGDQQAFIEEIKMLMTVDPDDEDYGINHADKGGGDDGERFTQAERDEEVKQLQSFLDVLEADPTAFWEEHFNAIPQKKNGTFYKNRVVRIWRGNTYRRYWEDSYGWNAPEFSIKVTDDYEAHLEITSRVEGW